MVIGYSMQHDQLGYYTASHRMVIFLWAYIISNLQRVVLPTLVNLHQTSTESFKSFVEMFLRYAAFFSLGIGVIITSLSGFIIQVLYSNKYNPSVPILQILIWAFVMATIRMILEIVFLATDRQKMYFYGMIFSAIIYTVFTPLLIYIYGITGAAYAALISESSYLIVLVALWCREHKSDIWKPLIKLNFAASVSIIMMFTIRVNTIIGILCATSLYLVALLSLKAFSLSELFGMYGLVKAVFRKKSIDV
jgi:O-antigen/teichoic acid export membrane protein